MFKRDTKAGALALETFQKQEEEDEDFYSEVSDVFVQTDRGGTPAGFKPLSNTSWNHSQWSQSSSPAHHQGAGT